MDGAFPSQKGQSFDSAQGGYGRGGAAAAAAAAARRGFRGTAENAKTKLCNRWLQGDCRFGDRCNFAHGDEELRQLPPRTENGTPTGGRFSSGPGRGGRGPGHYNNGRGGGQGYRPGHSKGGSYDEYDQQPYDGGYGGNAGHSDSRYAGDSSHAGPKEDGSRGPGGPVDDNVWAAQGYPVPGPNGWVMYRTRDTGEAYYHNHRTNLTQWDRPVEWPATGGPPQLGMA